MPNTNVKLELKTIYYSNKKENIDICICTSKVSQGQAENHTIWSAELKLSNLNSPFRYN